jgi:CPA2 family monovalent cation:H+ antiporter-2
LLTPWMVRASGRAANALDRRLPHVLQTYAALYGTWVAGLRPSPQRRASAEHRTAWSRIRRLVALLLIDVALVAAVAIGTSLGFPGLLRWLVAFTRGGAGGARVLLIGGAVALAAPFAIGAVRVARGLGLALAAEALPATARRLDLAAAPRRALLVSLQIAILLVAGLPLVAVTQPFVPGFPLDALLALGLVALAVPLWRGAADLHGHVRAGAQVILEALGTQSHTDATGTAAATSVQATGNEVHDLLPGMGRAGSLHLREGHHAVGRSLKEINLRGETGASVIAIQRAGGPVFPSADERLAAGDTLVLTGTEEAVAAARALLTNGP